MSASQHRKNRVLNMRTIVILISLAVSCYGSDDSPFTDLLKIISKDNSVKFNEHTNQHEDTSEEVFVLPNIIARENSAPINKLTNELEGKDEEYFQPPKDHTLDHTCELILKDFCPMPKSRPNKATVVNEDDYPRLARVFHSLDMYHPFLCTAFALSPGVFATAARCIATAKCGYTSVVYQKTIRMTCKALVFPPKPSRQLYKDIGFIVVNMKAEARWGNPIQFLRNLTFLDARYGIDERANTVVGYIADVKDPTQQQLYKLRDVIVSNFLCNKIYTMANNSDDYYVPCFHSCSPQQYFSKDPVCDAHMAGLGHAVFNKDKVLIGVATWSCKNNAANGQPSPLPVGLALIEGDTLRYQLLCAEKIFDDPERHGPGGSSFNYYCK